jgi:hypothetical protein
VIGLLLEYNKKNILVSLISLNKLMSLLRSKI